MVKTVTVTIDFPDNFIPPEKFDEVTYGISRRSKCEPCPFYGWEDETGFSWCDLPDVSCKDDACPIKKYFD